MNSRHPRPPLLHRVLTALLCTIMLAATALAIALVLHVLPVPALTGLLPHWLDTVLPAADSSTALLLLAGIIAVILASAALIRSLGRAR